MLSLPGAANLVEGNMDYNAFDFPLHTPEGTTEFRAIAARYLESHPRMSTRTAAVQLRRMGVDTSPEELYLAWASLRPTGRQADADDPSAPLAWEVIRSHPERPDLQLAEMGTICIVDRARARHPEWAAQMDAQAQRMFEADEPDPPPISLDQQVLLDIAREVHRQPLTEEERAAAWAQWEDRNAC